VVVNFLSYIWCFILIKILVISCFGIFTWIQLPALDKFFQVSLICPQCCCRSQRRRSLSARLAPLRPLLIVADHFNASSGNDFVIESPMLTGSRVHPGRCCTSQLRVSIRPQSISYRGSAMHHYYRDGHTPLFLNYYHIWLFSYIWLFILLKIDLLYILLCLFIIKEN
jgi:hypothetical protein